MSRDMITLIIILDDDNHRLTDCFLFKLPRALSGNRLTPARGTRSWRANCKHLRQPNSNHMQHVKHIFSIQIYVFVFKIIYKCSLETENF